MTDSSHRLAPPGDQVTLEDTITLVVEEAARQRATLTRTKLVKLLYFVDLKAFEAFGRTVTGVEWRWHHFGPFAYAISETCEEMARNEELEIEQTANWYGSPEFRIKSALTGYYNPPSSNLLRLVKLVVGDYGRFAASVLGDMSYDTEPMKKATSQGVRGVVIEFESPAPSSADVKRTVALYANLARATQGEENEGNVADGLRQEGQALRPGLESAMHRTVANG